MTDEEKGTEHLKAFDKNALFRKEIYADVNAGEIVCLVPVTTTNVRDPDRKQRFFSSIMASVRGQPNQIPFELAADTLEGAIELWPAVAEKAAADFKAKVEEQMLTRSLVSPSGARLSKPN